MAPTLKSFLFFFSEGIYFSVMCKLVNVSYFFFFFFFKANSPRSIGNLHLGKTVIDGRLLDSDG